MIVWGLLIYWTRKPLLLILSILLIITLISIPINIIEKSQYGDKLKVYILLNNGTEITGYTTKADYTNYLRQNDLKLTSSIVQFNTIKYAVQVYNGHGGVNLPY